MKAKLCDFGIDEGKFEPSAGWTVGRASTGKLDLCKAHAERVKDKTLRVDGAVIQRVLAEQPAKWAALTGAPAPAPLAVRPPMPGKGYGGFSLSGVKTMAGMDGQAFNATIRQSGTPVGYVSNDGNGGSDRFSWNGKPFELAFLKLAAERFPPKKPEVVDMADEFLVEELMVAAERLKWLEKGKKGGRPFCYQIVAKQYQFEDIVDDQGVTYTAYRSQAEADADLAKGKFVHAAPILDDGSLGEEIRGKTKPHVEKRTPEQIVVPAPKGLATTPAPDGGVVVGAKGGE
jgi:hypothetical protein